MVFLYACQREPKRLVKREVRGLRTTKDRRESQSKKGRVGGEMQKKTF